MSELKVGTKVVTPITNKDGETIHETGKLVSINSRWARIELSDGEVIKVGKTKVEAFVVEKEPETASTDRKEYIARMTQTRSASGRKSVDNNDDVAQMLRGLPLEAAYRVAAEALNTTAQDLLARYGHLNPGQQRMCLGNRMRGLAKK